METLLVPELQGLFEIQNSLDEELVKGFVDETVSKSLEVDRRAMQIV